MLIWNSRHTVQYRIDDISQIAGGPPVPDHCLELSRVTLRDGTEFTAYAVDLEKITNRAVAVIPAQPGYHILHFSPEFKDNESFLEPIIAWHVTEFGEMLPLTISGLWDDMHRPMPIRTPTSSVMSDGDSWPTVQSYIESAKHAHAEKRKAQAEAANG